MMENGKGGRLIPPRTGRKMEMDDENVHEWLETENSMKCQELIQLEKLLRLKLKANEAKRELLMLSKITLTLEKQYLFEKGKNHFWSLKLNIFDTLIIIVLKISF